MTKKKKLKGHLVWKIHETSDENIQQKQDKNIKRKVSYERLAKNIEKVEIRVMGNSPPPPENLLFRSFNSRPLNPKEPSSNEVL